MVKYVVRVFGHIMVLALLTFGTNLVPLRAWGQTDDLQTLSGQILGIDFRQSRATLTLDCRTNGVQLIGAPSEIAPFRVGDRIEATACRKSVGLTLRSIRRTGHGPLPEPVLATLPELAARRMLPTAIRGVVQTVSSDETNAEWNWLTLQTPTGRLAVSARKRDFPLADLLRLSDAEVLLKGYPTLLSTWREGLGENFTLVKEYAQEVLVPPPADRAKIPLWNGKIVPHRRRIVGTVVAATRHRLFVGQSARTTLELQLQEPRSDIGIGDRIEAVGFVERYPNGLLMTGTIVSRVKKGHPSAEAAQDTVLDDFFPDKPGAEAINSALLRRLVRLEGNVIGRMEEPGGRCALLLGDGRHTIEVDLSELPSELSADIGVGCLVRVTGLCLANVDYNRTTAERLHFRTFSILPRTPDDIALLARPPWWTSARLLVLVGILTVALAGILVWNRTLKVFSERCGRALFKEQIAHATAELRTGERTRLAVELHDSLSQNLAGVALQISTALLKQKTAPDVAAAHLATAERMLRSSRTELRRCLWDLREETLDEKNFADAVAKSVDPVSADAAVDIRFNVPRHRLTDTSAHAILRIVRELVSNAVTHGKATHVRIAGECHDDELSFSVADNGTGFAVDACPGVESGHFGLGGIRERVRSLRGTFALESQAGKGTRAVVRIKIVTPRQGQQTS